MAHIEFLEPAAEPADEPAATPDALAGRRSARWRAGRLADTVVTVLWLAAGALAVLAAYRPLYSIDYGSGRAGFGYTVDAWGKYRGAGATLPTQRGARYAPLLCGCAAAFGLLALAAATAARRRQRSRPGRRFDPATMATVGAIAAAGVLGGALAAMYLQVDSVLGGVRARVRFSAGFGDPIRGDLHTALGPSLALALAALICAALAAAGVICAPRR